MTTLNRSTNWQLFTFLVTFRMWERYKDKYTHGQIVNSLEICANFHGRTSKIVPMAGSYTMGKYLCPTLYLPGRLEGWTATSGGLIDTTGLHIILFRILCFVSQSSLQISVHFSAQTQITIHQKLSVNAMHEHIFGSWTVSLMATQEARRTWVGCTTGG